MIDMIERAKKGLPFDDILIIDSHCHMGFWHNFNAPGNSAEYMLESMDALGINIACIAAHSSIGPNYKYGNDMVIDTVLKYPDRFVGYATINPHYPEDIKNEMDRCLSIPGIKAIKLHPAGHRVPVDYKNYHNVYQFADENRYPILIHVFSQGDVAAVNRLAGEYTAAQFIMGHAGGEILAMEDAIDVVNRHENVYVDLAVSRTLEGNVEWFVKEMGSKKVLFGSDIPFYDPRPTFGRVAMANIAQEEKKDIFGLNMKKLLKLK